MTHDEARARVQRQFEEGPLPPLEAQALRAHLRQCEPCRAFYDRTVDLERALEGGAAVSSAQRDRVLAAGPPAPRRRLPRWIAPALALAAALAVALVVVPRADDLPQARGGGPTPGRRAWIAVYTAARGETPRPAEGRMRAGEGLLFAYTHLREGAARYLAIAGRDAAGRVHWFHPAYEAGSEPQSLPIEAGVADRELAEAVYVEPAAGRFEICALFTETPLRVVEVDARLERGEPWPEGATRDCHVLEVSK